MLRVTPPGPQKCLEPHPENAKSNAPWAPKCLEPRPLGPKKCLMVGRCCPAHVLPMISGGRGAGPKRYPSIAKKKEEY